MIKKKLINYDQLLALIRSNFYLFFSVMKIRVFVMRKIVKSAPETFR